MRKTEFFFDTGNAQVYGNPNWSRFSFGRPVPRPRKGVQIVMVLVILGVDVLDGLPPNNIDRT